MDPVDKDRVIERLREELQAAKDSNSKLAKLASAKAKPRLQFSFARPLRMLIWTCIRDWDWDTPADLFSYSAIVGVAGGTAGLVVQHLVAGTVASSPLGLLGTPLAWFVFAGVRSWLRNALYMDDAAAYDIVRDRILG